MSENVEVANRGESPAGQEKVYTLLNDQGTAPLLIACDHAGNRLPENSNGLGIDPALLTQHIGYDIGAEAVSRLLCRKFDATTLLAHYSRLYVDLNRFPGDPGQMPERSDGHLIAGNVGLNATDIEARLERYFHPYHDCHAQLVDRLKDRFRRPIILSVHSFTPQMSGRKRPWHFGVLWDKDQDLARSMINSLRNYNNGELVVGNNEPYHAAEPRGYAINMHAAEKNVEMALIEIRQDLIVTEAGQQWAAEIIFDTLNPLLDYRTP